MAWDSPEFSIHCRYRASFFVKRNNVTEGFRSLVLQQFKKQQTVFLRVLHTTHLYELIAKTVNDFRGISLNNDYNINYKRILKAT